jgi:calreticulin
MQVISMLAAFAAVACAEVYFEETFSGDWESKWVQGKPAGKEMGKWTVTPGKWFVDEEVNKGLTTSEDMRFYSIGAPLDKVASSKGKTLVLQFSTKIENHQYAYCGGGYIKLLPEAAKLETLGGDDEYHIMFGPDLCGYDVSHIHAIFNHKGKNLLKTDKISLEYSDKNEYTHLYTLVVNPDGTYEVLFDLESKSKGTLLEAWDFPNPMIDDASDKKPTDWVDETEMDDPEAKKPEGWDDIPAQIPDPDATKPEDWDDEDDGEWEPPLIDNPDFKGEWVAPKVANPDYKGEWKPAQIPDPDATKPEDWDDEDDGEWEPPLIDNPDFKGEWIAPKVANPDYKGEWSPKQIANKDFEEGVQLAAYDSAKIGFELWIVNNGTIFDNILVTDDLEYAKAQGEKLWKPTSAGEKEKKEAWDKENKPADDMPSDDEEMPDDEGEEDEPEKDEL